MNCRFCHTSMTLIAASDRFLCETCQHSSPRVPDSPPSSNTTIKPSGRPTSFFCGECDQIQLEVGVINKTEVCFCGGCGGFVVDRASFGELVEELRAAYAGPDNSPQMLDPEDLETCFVCVACRSLTEPMLYNGPGNVAISTCETCKVSWIRNGDLDRIVRAPGMRSFEQNLPGYTIMRTGLLQTPTIFYHE